MQVKNSRNGKWQLVIGTCQLSLLCLLTASAACSENPASEVEVKTRVNASQPLSNEDSWKVFYINDQRVGFSHTRYEVIEETGSRIVEFQQDTHMELKRFGKPLSVELQLKTRETANGALLSYEFVIKNPPADPKISQGTVEGGELKIDTSVANQVRQSRLKWKSTYHSPSYLERVFRKSPLKPGETQSFSILLPEHNQVTEVTLSAKEYETIELPDGSSDQCLHVVMQKSVMPGVNFDLYVKNGGAIIKESADFLGATMVGFQATEAEALRKKSDKQLDFSVQGLIKTDAVKNMHNTDKVVYQISLPGGDPAKLFPSSDLQQVKRRNEHQAEVTVFRAAVPKEFPESKVKAEYLSPSQFLQSDDPQIIKYAATAVQSETDPWKQARLLENFVYRNLKKKNFSTALASASEVARNMEGDCTEHAVLLAAMLRAQKLPSRVVVGFVYIPALSSFVGHMWVEVFLDQRWIPLDATLGKGGIGGGHLKMSASSLTETAPAPLEIFLPILQSVGKLSIKVLDFSPPAAP